jgi:hypothetical protein
MLHIGVYIAALSVGGGFWVIEWKKYPFYTLKLIPSSDFVAGRPGIEYYFRQEGGQSTALPLGEKGEVLHLYSSVAPGDAGASLVVGSRRENIFF